MSASIAPRRRAPVGPPGARCECRSARAVAAPPRRTWPRGRARRPGARRSRAPRRARCRRRDDLAPVAASGPMTCSGDTPLTVSPSEAGRSPGRADAELLGQLGVEVSGPLVLHEHVAERAVPRWRRERRLSGTRRTARSPRAQARRRGTRRAGGHRQPAWRPSGPAGRAARRRSAAARVRAGQTT